MDERLNCRQKHNQTHLIEIVLARTQNLWSNQSRTKLILTRNLDIMRPIFLQQTLETRR